MNALSFLPKSRTALFATAILAAFGVAACMNEGFAADTTKISGSFTGTYAKKEAVPVGNAEDGHVLMLTTAEGKNVNSGKTDYLDGASVENKEIDDLVQGNGPQKGYCAMTKGADSILVKWEGQVTTVLDPDKTPKTTMKGKWSYVSGTGQYAGITGSGTYAGNMASENAYHIAWKGAYAIGKPAASN